ncbi:hypothetical protein IMSHALPRED_000875 [Imshaugia aleurites]|uniref:Uncharacterized protein n=1 Tax=Imshaugia aleurites TaxID=172621 RepID=A0A8H3EZ94_9LECA|nr:hypothetical protein IMSHALPRED_000875 [Imshaugia aleurites]
MAQDVSQQANEGIMVLIGKESGEAYKDDDDEEEDGGGNFSYVTDEEGQWSRTKMGKDQTGLVADPSEDFQTWRDAKGFHDDDLSKLQTEGEVTLGYAGNIPAATAAEEEDLG